MRDSNQLLASSVENETPCFIDTRVYKKRGQGVDSVNQVNAINNKSIVMEDYNANYSIVNSHQSKANPAKYLVSS